MSALDRDELIRSGRNLALSIARSWAGAGSYRDDLVGASQVALILAAARYDPARGSWPAFLAVQVRRACAQELRRLRSPVRLPRGHVAMFPCVAEPRANEDGEEIHAVDELVDERPDAEAEAEQEQNRIMVRAALRMLRPRDRRVVELRYLDPDGTRSLHQVGQVLHVTRERVRQVEVRAMARLRRTLT